MHWARDAHLVGALHGGQAVRDHHHRAPLHQLLYRRLHQPLVLGILGAGGLIQDEDGGILRAGGAAGRGSSEWRG